MKPDLMIVSDAPEERAETSHGEQCVPLDALAMPGDGEEMTNPEAGDPVSYTVEGKVTRVEGGKAYVTPETINGKPVDAGTENEPATEPDPAVADDAGLNELQGMAGQQGMLG